MIFHQRLSMRHGEQSNTQFFAMGIHLSFNIYTHHTCAFIKNCKWVYDNII